MAHLIGYTSTTDNAKRNPCGMYRPRNKAPQTVDVEAALCDKRAPVTVRFLRNEYVLWDATSNRNGRRAGLHGAMLCDWADQARRTDVAAVVLNRGHHYAPDDAFASEVNRTMSKLGASFRQSGRDVRNLVWLSTFASLPGCATLPDPLPAARADGILRAMTGPYVNQYHWGVKERQNSIARRAVDSVGGSYIEAFPATRVRPGGRRGILDRERNALRNRTVEDCVHWCLPGPLDAFSRLILAYLISE